MKRFRKILWRAVALAAVLGAVAFGLFQWALGGAYESEQTATRTFTIDHDFTSVRKILVRKDAAKQLVVMGGDSEFVSQRWSSFGADIGSIDLLNAEWKVQLHGVLTVRTKDPYIGEHAVDLEQDVTIEPNYLHSEVELDRPAERLRDYRMTTHFARDERTDRARVELKLTQRILTHAPWFAHAIADRRVRESVEKTLAGQEAAIRKLIAENINDVPLLPLR